MQIVTQIAHLGWATSGPSAPMAATGGPPMAHPPHRWRAIWGVNIVSMVKVNVTVLAQIINLLVTDHANTYTLALSHFPTPKAWPGLVTAFIQEPVSHVNGSDIHMCQL